MWKNIANQLKVIAGALFVWLAFAIQGEMGISLFTVFVSAFLMVAGVIWLIIAFTQKDEHWVEEIIRRMQLKATEVHMDKLLDMGDDEEEDVGKWPNILTKDQEDIVEECGGTRADEAGRILREQLIRDSEGGNPFCTLSKVKEVQDA